MYMTMVERQDKIKRKQRVKLNIIIKKTYILNIILFVSYKK
jgi:hypothetical protein